MANVSYGQFINLVLDQTSHGTVYESSARAFYRHYDNGEMTFEQAVDGCARDCDLEQEDAWDRKINEDRVEELWSKEA